MKPKKILSIVLCLAAAAVLGGCAKPVARSTLALDTVVTIALEDGGSQADIDRAFETIADFEKKIDAFDPGSEIRRVSQNPTALSPDVYALLEKNVAFAEQADGAFDPVLGNLIALWDIQEPVTKEPPSAEAVRAARAHSGIDKLTLDPAAHTAAITDGAAVNLGASAKGYLGDVLKQQLEAAGVTRGILNLGGNVVLIGKRGPFQKYSVGIDLPEPGADRLLGVLKAEDESVVTSGNYQRYFTGPDGTRYHHLLDPKTGYPADSGLLEVVVAAPSSLEADMLSTALYIMGREAGSAFLKRYDPDGNIGVIFVADDHTVWVRENIKHDFTLEPDNRQSWRVSVFS